MLAILVFASTTRYPRSHDMTDHNNIAKNKVSMRNKYKNLTQSLKSSHDQVKYMNLSLGACGIIGKGSKPFFHLLEELKTPDNENIS